MCGWHMNFERVCIKHTHRASAVALSLIGLKLARFQDVKNQASSKRLPMMSSDAVRPPFHAHYAAWQRLFGAWMAQNYEVFLAIQANGDKMS